MLSDPAQKISPAWGRRGLTLHLAMKASAESTSIEDQSCTIDATAKAEYVERGSAGSGSPGNCENLRARQSGRSRKVRAVSPPVRSHWSLPAANPAAQSQRRSHSRPIRVLAPPHERYQPGPVQALEAVPQDRQRQQRRVRLDHIRRREAELARRGCDPTTLYRRACCGSGSGSGWWRPGPGHGALERVGPAEATLGFLLGIDPVAVAVSLSGFEHDVERGSAGRAGRGHGGGGEEGEGREAEVGQRDSAERGGGGGRRGRELAFVLVEGCGGG